MTTAPPAESATVDDLALVDAWWRAANYLSVGQIYLLDNPLLRQPLTLDHVKPRLLGHWGTTPGLNLIYAHLNRVILARDREMNEYREGDLVTVEGEVISDRGSPRLGGPLYRVRSMTLVDRPR